MTIYQRDESMPLREQVRQLTIDRTPEDEMLDFVPAAIAIGCNLAEAEAIDEELTVRIMRSSGAI